LINKTYFSLTLYASYSSTALSLTLPRDIQLAKSQAMYISIDYSSLLIGDVIISYSACLFNST